MVTDLLVSVTDLLVSGGSAPFNRQASDVSQQKGVERLARACTRVSGGEGWGGEAVDGEADRSALRAQDRAPRAFRAGASSPGAPT